MAVQSYRVQHVTVESFVRGRQEQGLIRAATDVQWAVRMAGFDPSGRRQDPDGVFDRGWADSMRDMLNSPDPEKMATFFKELGIGGDTIKNSVALEKVLERMRTGPGSEAHNTRLMANAIKQMQDGEDPNAPQGQQRRTAAHTAPAPGA